MAANHSTDCTISLICGLCNETYQYKDGPLMLPCLHSFCKTCLSKYIQEKTKSVDNKMACPTCYNSFPLPEDINSFPVNLHLSRLARSRVFEKQVEEGNVKCQVCNDDPKEATSFCCHCCEFLCEKCKHCHLRYLGKEHEILEFANYRRGEFQVKCPSPKCPQHTKQELDIFFNECQELICLECAQKDHQDHMKGSLDETSEEEKDELQKLMSGVDKALGKLDEALQQIQEMRKKVKVSAERETIWIDKACDDLIQSVEDRRKILQRKILQRKCREIAKGKDDVLLNQMVELKSLRNELTFAQLHAKNTIDSHSPQEILSVKKFIQHRLNQKMEVYQHKPLELREDDTIKTSLYTSLKNEIQKFGYFPGVPDSSKSYAEELAGEGKERKVMVVLNDEEGDPVENNGYFQYHIRKAGDDTDENIPLKVNIVQSNKKYSTATLGFTADKPGEYQVTIMVRNRPITYHNRITDRQSRHYKDFRNMPVTYKHVGGCCYDVAVHDNGTIYATDYDNNTIKVFRPDGTEGQIGGPDEAGGNLVVPWGITILKNTIYTVSRSEHVVKMYSTDGRFIEGFGNIGDKKFTFTGSSPRAICIDRTGRLLVADSKGIHIFTPEGNFINSIPCSIDPNDFAVDPVGNVHVPRQYAGHIAVYSQDGEQIETYNFGGKLQGPRGIYIDGDGNRFVYGAGLLIVVDSTGELISSREVDGAVVITGDKNGIIYATESIKNRIVIY